MTPGADACVRVARSSTAAGQRGRAAAVHDGGVCAPYEPIRAVRKYLSQRAQDGVANVVAQSGGLQATAPAAAARGRGAIGSGGGKRDELEAVMRAVNREAHGPAR